MTLFRCRNSKEMGLSLTRASSASRSNSDVVERLFRKALLPTEFVLKADERRGESDDSLSGIQKDLLGQGDSSAVSRALEVESFLLE
jgi:hypothetical protein